MIQISNDRLKEILDEIDSATGHTFDEREHRKIIIELLHLREKRIQDNLDIAHYLSEIGALKEQVDTLRGLVRRLAKHLDRRRMKEINESENG